jgi:signal transduction histidine kinase
MTEPETEQLSALSHTFNNLLGKIMGAAELALDHDSPPQVRGELSTILRLADEGAGLVAELRAAASGD